MNDGNTVTNLSGLLLKLFVFLLSIPALLACGMFAGDPSPTSTPAPVMVSANVLTPVATGEAPGADDRPDEELSVPTPETNSDAGTDLHAGTDTYARAVSYP